MANFTINSLASGALNNDDNFLKSDSAGVLTKVSLSDLKQSIAESVAPNISIDSLTPLSSKITLGSINTAVKYGRLVLVNIVFALSSDSEVNENLFRLPYMARYPFLGLVRNDANGTTCLVGQFSEGGNLLNAPYAYMPAGTYRGSFTYVSTAQ